MFRLFFSLATLLYISFFLSYLLKASFSKTISASYLVLAFIVMFSSYFGKISYFKYGLLFFFLVSFIYLILNFKKRDLMQELKVFFKPSIIVFVLLYIYIYFNSANMQLSNTDDLGYWASSTRDVLRNDVWFGKEAYFTFSVIYPPLTNFIQIAFSKMLGYYCDRHIIFGMSTFSMSFIFPFFEKYEFKKKDIVKIFLTTIICIFVLLSIQDNHWMNGKTYIFNSVYVDWVLGLELAFSFYLIADFYNNKTANIALLALVNTAMALTKQLGLAFVLLDSVTLLVKLIIDKKINKKILIRIFSFFLVGTIVYYSWTFYSSSAKYVSTSISILNEATNSVVGDTLKIQTAKNFIRACIFEPIIKHPFNMSYLFITIFVSLILFIIIKVRDKNNRGDYVLPIFYFLGSLGYALAIMLSYMFLFGYPEGVTLAMFGRYMQTYTYAGYLVILYLIFLKSIEFSKTIILAILAFFFVEPLSIDTFIYQKERHYLKEEETEKMAYYFECIYDNKPMLVVNQTDMHYQAKIKYIADTKTKNMRFMIVGKDISDENFKDLFNNYDWLLIGDYDNTFYKLWQKISDTALYNSTLYKIEHTENGNIFIIDEVFENTN